MSTPVGVENNTDHEIFWFNLIISKKYIINSQIECLKINPLCFSDFLILVKKIHKFKFIDVSLYKKILEKKNLHSLNSSVVFKANLSFLGKYHTIYPKTWYSPTFHRIPVIYISRQFITGYPLK
ncbi:hypothetical protein BpHYR1_012033 [Brachionus plicatilis]|uniref:Uncharacterized protein n=1 Tax=Brachionus plicatilis TaxID=10195 RepID=A0A3M7QB94_BRAPC|nr:hypothetical protein BpHYR1_012033 [Brachionus plicatilis]